MQWDEACRTFSFALIEACGSRRLIDLQRKFFDQGRRFRLALLREGQHDFPARKHRKQRLLDAVLARDRDTAVNILVEDIETDLKSRERTDSTLD